MGQYTVLAFAVILFALSGYYLRDWWLEEKKESALALAPPISLAKQSRRGHSKETGPQELSAGMVWYLPYLSIALSTCTTVCVCGWVFIRERRESEARERIYKEQMEEKRREKEEREKRRLEEMQETRRIQEETLQLIRTENGSLRQRLDQMQKRILELSVDREVTERMIWLPDGTVMAERRTAVTNYGHHRGYRSRADELKRFLAEKRRAMVQHIKDLRAIADGVDKFHKGASIAKVTGSTISAAGGIISIVGLALIPVTLGASVILSAVGAGVAIAGGVTNVAAGAAEAKSNSTDKKDVQKILQSSAEDLDGVWKVIDDYAQDILTQVNDEYQERLLKELEDIKWEFFNVAAMGNTNFNIDASNFVKDFIKSLTMLITSLLDDIIKAAAAGAAKAGARAAAGTAAKVTGIAGAIFLPLDIFDIVRGSIHIHKGAKSDMAAKIREIADKMEKLIMRRPQDNAILGTERRKEITDSPKGGY
ncbi:apolipoprotein L1-like [Lissotriton helveticus]